MKKKVLFINPYIPTLGGGEKHMAYMCQFVEKYYNYDVDIDILVHDYNNIKVDDDNYVTIEDINNQFGLELKCTKIRKEKLPIARNFFERRRNRLRISEISSEYDLMVNFKFLSNEVGKAKHNLYGCMFPTERLSVSRSWWKKPYAWGRDYQFYNSYDSFIANSKYTYHWIEKYWKKIVKIVLYILLYLAKMKLKDAMMKVKKKILLLVLVVSL